MNENEQGKKYCRYCSWCVCGDWYYCGKHDKQLKRVDRVTNCEHFHLSELGDVDTGRQYAPRPKKAKLEQITFEGGNQNNRE